MKIDIPSMATRYMLYHNRICSRESGLPGHHQDTGHPGQEGEEEGGRRPRPRGLTPNWAVVQHDCVHYVDIPEINTTLNNKILSNISSIHEMSNIIIISIPQSSCSSCASCETHPLVHSTLGLTTLALTPLQLLE